MFLRFLLCVVIMCGSQTGIAALTKTSLKSALSKGLVSLNASATGKSFHEKGLQLDIQNKTNQPIQLFIDPAMIFQPSDVSYQDLMISGEILVVIPASAKQSVELQTFCAKSDARAPSKELTFTFKQQGDSSMIKLMKFTNKHKYYGMASQHAVWVFTNHHDLSGIFDITNPVLSGELAELVSLLSGLSLPDDYRVYEIDASSGMPVFKNRVLKIYSVIRFTLEAEKNLSLAIYDDDGKVIQGIEKERKFARGHHKMRVEFEAERVKAGSYYVRLTEDGRIMKENKVTID